MFAVLKPLSAHKVTPVRFVCLYFVIAFLFVVKKKESLFDVCVCLTIEVKDFDVLQLHVCVGRATLEHVFCSFDTSIAPLVCGQTAAQSSTRLIWGSGLSYYRVDLTLPFGPSIFQGRS